MRVCLSGRIAEGSPRMPTIREFTALAKDSGYDGIGLRPWQTPPNMSDSQIDELAGTILDSGLTVCSITSDCSRQTVTLAQRLGTKVIQIGGPPESWTRQAINLPADMRAGPQMHTGTPYERIGLAAEVLATLGDARLGMVIEPGNLLLVGTRYGRDTFEPLRGKTSGAISRACWSGRGRQAWSCWTAAK